VQASENVSPVRAISTPAPNEKRVGRADGVGVEAGAGGDPAAARSAVAEMHRDAVVGMADDGEERAADERPLNFSSTTSVMIWPCSPPWNDGRLGRLELVRGRPGSCSTALSHVSA
jgi:hypothetical protein